MHKCLIRLPLFRLNASEQNKRYTFFGMDAGVGVDTKIFGCLVEQVTLVS